MPKNNDHSKSTCICCNTVITESMAMTHEGKEYIHHFCSKNCIDKWKESNPEDKTDDENKS